MHFAVLCLFVLGAIETKDLKFIDCTKQLPIATSTWWHSSNLWMYLGNDFYQPASLDTAETIFVSEIKVTEVVDAAHALGRTPFV